jgi:integrase
MTSTLEQALRRLEVVREGFVVRNRDGSAKTDGQANAAILRICRRAGLPEKRWHTLRHAFGTHAALFGSIRGGCSRGWATSASTRR